MYTTMRVREEKGDDEGSAKRMEDDGERIGGKFMQHKSE
jgi:hypothetical protein